MSKKRISLTLEESLVDRIDRKAELEEIDNRSRAVEKFLETYLDRENISKAIILCGGDQENPKCLSEHKGKPLIKSTVEHLKEHGIQRIIITGGENIEKIEKKLGEENIDFIKEEKPLGTAGSIRNLEDRIKDTFLVVNGDVYCRPDIDDMVEKHRRSGAVATIALTTRGDPTDYGVVRMKGSRIVGFKEKPGQAATNLINAGMYVMSPEILEMFPAEEERSRFDIEEMFEQIAEKEKLQGYLYEGTWKDLGR